MFLELYKVKQQLANLLRRWPTMHRLTSKVYLKAYHSVGPRRQKEYLLGTRVREKWWATRHLRKSQSDDWGKGSNDWIKGYWNSINHSHRSFLVEWHFNSQGKDPSGFGAYHLGYWKRDYAALLKQFVQEEQIRIIKIPEELWGGQWANLGCVIEVLL